MDTPTQSSFIPHDAVSTPSTRRGGGLPELGTLIAVLLLIVSCALAGGVFLYSQYLQTSGKNKLDQLNRAKSSIDTNFVTQVTKLDDRMHVAETLLQSHIATDQIFNALEAATIQDVAFYTFQYNASDPKQIKVTMSGVAGSVNAIALQAQVFSQSNIITNPIFSGIDRQQDGVHFTFDGSVNPDAVNYEKYINGNTVTTQAAQQPSAQPQNPGTVFDQTSQTGSSTPGQ